MPDKTPALPRPLAHAYLVTGGNGESRRAFARRLAAGWLCQGEDPPCGRCGPCGKVERGTHPDVRVWTPAPGKQLIPVESAREMRADVFIRPNEGKRKVYVIDPAEALNGESQNVLLKVLEDGPDYAAFALLCGEPGRLLETVRSRCETITLPPEQEPPDPEAVRRGEELAQLMLYGGEWELAQWLTALEMELDEGQGTSAAKTGEALAVFASAEEAACRELGRARRAVRVVTLLKHCREIRVYNPGVGHLAGWLCAELFR